MMPSVLKFPPAILKAEAKRLFLLAGLQEGDADLVAETLIEANLRGVDSHGFAALPTYLRRLREGGTNPQARPRVVREGETWALIDGDNGIGMVTAVLAMNKALEKAREYAVGVSLCYNNTTFGAAFYYTWLAAYRGMIGIALSNAPPSMPPWGGKKALLGTNPVSLAFPRRDKEPIIVDMATSAAAKQKIYRALELGREIPEGWALDKNGNPTTNPAKALEGLIMPLGGIKGYALALAVDLLCGGLSGGGCMDAVRSLSKEAGSPQNVSFLLAALDPDKFCGYQRYYELVEEIAEKIHQCPRVEGVDTIYLPGEIEEKTRAERLNEGIPVPGKVLEELKMEARALGGEIHL